VKLVDPQSFERKLAEAAKAAEGDKDHMIRTVMNRSDWLILGGLALIWGGAFFFIAVAVRHVPPLTYVWLRLTIAAAAMWLLVRARGQGVGLPREVWGSIFLLALLNNAIPFALFGWGQTHIASGLASILVATMIGPSLLSNLGGSALAQLACVTASLSYALAAVWARRFRRMGVSPLSVTTGQLTAGAIMMLPVSMIVDRPWTHAFPPLTAWGAIIALALLCTAFGYVLYFRLIETSGATNALLVTLLVPPVAILLGALFLGEKLAPQDFAGLGLIALGLAAIDGRLISAIAPRRPRPAA
jgi:drug/metabolite transporter (DMT)-like permease